MAFLEVASPQLPRLTAIPIGHYIWCLWAGQATTASVGHIKHLSSWARRRNAQAGSGNHCMQPASGPRRVSAAASRVEPGTTCNNRRKRVATRATSASWQAARCRQGSGSAQRAPQLAPIKARPRIEFSARRDVFMAHDLTQPVVARQQTQQACQRKVLAAVEAQTVQALQLDANGPVIAVLAVSPTGNTRMPGTLMTRHELQHTPTAADKEVRRHPQVLDGLEVRVGGCVQGVGEETLHRVATPMSRRQTDGMNDRQRGHDPRRTRAEVGAGPVRCALPPAVMPCTTLRHRRQPGGSVRSPSPTPVPAPPPKPTPTPTPTTISTPIPPPIPRRAMR